MRDNIGIIVPEHLVHDISTIHRDIRSERNIIYAQEDLNIPAPTPPVSGASVPMASQSEFEY